MMFVNQSSNRYSAIEKSLYLQVYFQLSIHLFYSWSGFFFFFFP